MCSADEYKPWNYSRLAFRAVLRTTQLPLPRASLQRRKTVQRMLRYAHPRHTSAWWAAHSRGQDFSVEDDLDTDQFNRALWLGLGAEGHSVSGASDDGNAICAKIASNCWLIIVNGAKSGGDPASAYVEQLAGQSCSAVS